MTPKALHEASTLSPDDQESFVQREDLFRKVDWFIARLLQTFTRTAGESVRFLCGHPLSESALTLLSNATLNWKLNDLPLAMNPSRVVYYKGNVDLTELSPADTGVYTCEVRYSQDGAVNNLTVGVYSLQVTTESPTNIVFDQEPFTLHCNSQSLGRLFPASTRQWLHNGSVVTSPGTTLAYNTSADVIKRVTRSAQGVWECHVMHSSSDRIWKTAWYDLAVEDGPSGVARLYKAVTQHLTLVIAVTAVIVVVLCVAFLYSALKERDTEQEAQSTFLNVRTGWEKVLNRNVGETSIDMEKLQDLPNAVGSEVDKSGSGSGSGDSCSRSTGSRSSGSGNSGSTSIFSRGDGISSGDSRSTSNSCSDSGSEDVSSDYDEVEEDDNVTEEGFLDNRGINEMGIEEQSSRDNEDEEVEGILYEEDSDDDHADDVRYEGQGESDFGEIVDSYNDDGGNVGSLAVRGRESDSFLEEDEDDANASDDSSEDFLTGNANSNALMMRAKQLGADTREKWGPKVMGVSPRGISKWGLFSSSNVSNNRRRDHKTEHRYCRVNNRSDVLHHFTSDGIFPLTQIGLSASSRESSSGSGSQVTPKVAMRWLTKYSKSFRSDKILQDLNIQAKIGGNPPSDDNREEIELLELPNNHRANWGVKVLIKDKSIRKPARLKSDESVKAIEESKLFSDGEPNIDHLNTGAVAAKVVRFGNTCIQPHQTDTLENIKAIPAPEGCSSNSSGYFKGRCRRKLAFSSAKLDSSRSRERRYDFQQNNSPIKACPRSSNPLSRTLEDLAYSEMYEPVDVAQRGQKFALWHIIKELRRWLPGRHQQRSWTQRNGVRYQRVLQADFP